VKSVAWSPSGERLASASGDKTLMVWDNTSGMQGSRLEGHTAEVKSVAWSPSGDKLASASSDKTVAVWESASGEQIAPLAGAWSSDGKGLPSGEIEIAVRTRDAKSGERVVAAAEAFNPVSSDIVSTSVVGESLRAAGGRVGLGEGRGSSWARELEDEETTGGRGVAPRCCRMC
jgi:dipeptidyl aminopeptidase/acylaminoacyl peptidase